MPAPGPKTVCVVKSLYFWMAVGLLVGGGAQAQAAEWRAFWVDAWGAGFHSQSEVETLLGRVGDPNIKGQIRDANCNAVVVQVRRRADVCYPSGKGEPYMSGLSPSNFNGMQAMIDAAHDTTGGKQRIEVHCWLVTFATAGGAVYLRHNNPADPANYWVTLDNLGNETDDKAFDPGHPNCLQYLNDVCMDMVTNFDIDGIHYDYIRFTGSNQGYNPTSIARYNTRYGLTGQPSASNEQFKQWRCDQVTSLVRKVYANIQAVKPHVRQSGSFVTWNPSPTSSTRSGFMGTRPYYDVYSDWDSWMQEGIMDMAVPMTYYNWASLPSDYTRWINFEKDRKGNRHMIIGPGIYLNSLSNAILELQMTRDASPAGNHADGFCGYSYRVPYNGGTWSGFAPSLVAQVTPTPDVIPDMPWKSEPTTGHIMGTVTYASSGEWADHALVSIVGPQNRNMYVDGTGFYAFIDLPPGSYTLTASKAGYPDAVANAQVAISQVIGNMYVRDLALGGTSAPAISNVQATNVTTSSATITWTTDQAASSQVEYGLDDNYGQTSDLDGSEVTSHSVMLGGLTPSTQYHYRVLSMNDNGEGASTDFTFNTAGPPMISNAQATTITNAGATITWDTSSPSDSRVRYGLTSLYGTETPIDATLVASHSIAIHGLMPNTTYHYQAVSSNTYGSDESGDGTFTTTDVAAEIVIDNTDPGWSNTSPSGGWTSGSNPAVPKIGSDYLYAAGTGSTNEASATRSCTWVPAMPGWGVYDVYVYYQIGANRTSGAPYKVVHSGGEVVSVQNQYSVTPNQADWFLIGENLLFGPGTAGYVKLSNNTQDTGLVSADAVKFVYKGGDPTPPSMAVVTDDGEYSGSMSALHAQWQADDLESGVKQYEYRIIQAGGAIVRDWTDAGTAVDVNAEGLQLTMGAMYFFEVRAVNHGDLVGPVGASDGILVFTFDANDDGHVDAVDTDAFLQCSAGANVAYPTGIGLDCRRFDTNVDLDVDQEDFAVFQRCMTGQEPVNTTCLTLADG